MPKRFSLTIVFLLLSIFSYGQVNEDFSDGDFTNAPTWSGNASSFKINTSHQLQLSGVVADTSYLSTSNSSIDDTEWDIWLKISLAPTLGNNERIYLVSDQQNLKGSLNGYGIYLGPNKDVEMFKQTGLSSVNIFTGIAQHVSKTVNSISLKITRDHNGLWSIYSDTTGGGNYVPEGNPFTDISYYTTNYFGIFCLYTISNATKFYFDDIYIGPIKVDTIPPAITGVAIISNQWLDIRFNEAVDFVTTNTITNFAADNGLGNPNTATRDGIDLSLVHLTFANPFVNGIIYHLLVNGIADLYNNVLLNSISDFGIPFLADSLDIVINEIMYAPKTGGSDYVELYNRSDKIFDLKDYALANVGYTSGLVMDTVPISDVSRLFLPGEYVVLSGVVSNVLDQYYTPNPTGFVQLPRMPQFYADSGGVAILQANKIIDRFIYSNDLQFPMLNDFHGVSLERINFDRPTQDNTNWHSASEVVGFGTPAYKNSQFISDVHNGNTFYCEPKIFSPNNDGRDDVVNFHYHFDMAGKVGSLTIFDSQGRLVRTLVNNELLGVDGSFSWDGVNDVHQKALIGIYVGYLNTFDLKGNTDSIKNSCILAANL